MDTVQWKKLQNDGRKEAQCICVCNLKAYFILYLCIFWVITTVTDESNNIAHCQRPVKTWHPSLLCTSTRTFGLNG